MISCPAPCWPGMLMREAIIAALRMEGVCETVIERYMADAGEIEFSKTANRSMVAKMNQAVYAVSLMQDYLDENRGVFGSGHSVIPVLDVFPRYGGFVGFHPMMDPRLMWFNVVGPGGAPEPRAVVDREKRGVYCQLPQELRA